MAKSNSIQVKMVSTANTGYFYVDDYSGTPTISVDNTVTGLSITGTTYLFGIPSITQINVNITYNVSTFASHIIPYSNNRHSRICQIIKNTYTLPEQVANDITSNTNYGKNYTPVISINAGTFDSSTGDTITIEVYYLNHNGTPDVSLATYSSETYNNLNKIFRDTTDNHDYTNLSLHFFDATTSDISATAIAVNDASFATTYISKIASVLLRFDNKFVSGGFTADYSSTTLGAFSDWSDGYSVAGPTYQNNSDTGSGGGYKWIAINVTTKKNGNRIDLSNFKINNNYPVLSTFNNSTTGYRAYISHDNKFGSLERVSNSGETSWFNNASNTTITEADSINGALQTNENNSSIYDAFIDSTTSSDIYLIVGLPQNQNTYFIFT